MIIIIVVNDISEQMNNVEMAGGKVLGQPIDILGVGLYVPPLDTEGNRVSMLQPAMNMQTS